MTATAIGIPGYDLDFPNGDGVIQSLSRLGGPDKARTIWDDTCRSVGVPATTYLPLEQLRMVAEALKKQPGIVSVVGGSLCVRIASYSLLQHKASS